MKSIRFTSWPALVLPLLILAASCSSESTFETDVTNDCLITAATMGGLKRTVTQKNAACKDTTYVVNLTGALYPLYIDQLNNRIYNADSLPVGTHVEKTVFSAFNATGTVLIKSLHTDADTMFVMTDSTDCSVPRQLTVYSSDGLSRRTYRLEVNLHKEEGDSFRWNRMCTAQPELARLAGAHRTLAADGRLLVFGTAEGQPRLLQCSADAPAEWSSTPLPPDFDVRSVQRFDGRFFALVGGKVCASADGSEWTPTGSALAPDALVAAGSRELFAVADGQFYSSADGVTWTADEADRTDQLPAGKATGTCVPSATDPLMEDIVVAGLNAEGTPVVWRRNIDLTGTNTFGWYYLPAIPDYAYNCPALTAATVVTYDGGTVMTGLDGAGNVAPLYWSQDNGRTWVPDELTNPLTAGSGATSLSAATDEDGFLWLVAGGSGEVWRGRHNRLGWTETQTSFERSLRADGRQ